MERCGFFDANLVGEEYDRVYLAKHFAAYFASFIANGVFAEHSNQLQVMSMSTPQMQISVEKGQGWINGYWYENTDEMQLSIDVADGVLNRIDSVVLRLGFSERNVWLAIKKGTPAISPTAPEITRSTDYYELQLATISIPASSIKITQAQITDTRMDESVCGWVTGVVKQLDTTTLFNQFEAYFAEFKESYETDFETWFETIKGQLSEDAAGKLQLQLDDHENRLNDHESRLNNNESKLNNHESRLNNHESRLNNTEQIDTVMRREMDCLNGVREKGNLIDVDTLMGYVRAGEHHKYALGDYFEDNGVQWAVAARNWYPAWAFGDGAARPEHIICMPVGFLATLYNFNESDTNRGGYAGSKMPANMETEFGKLGSKVKAYCKRTRIYENNKDAWAAATRGMRLPTIVEVTGNKGWANGYSGGVSSQLPLCKNSLFRIRDTWYWAADPDSTNNSNFCFIFQDGRSTGYGASAVGHVRPLIVLA